MGTEPMASKIQDPEQDHSEYQQPETTAVYYLEVSLQEMASEPPEARLGERIRYARNSLKLNLEAFSRLTKDCDTQGTGLSTTSISRYETGDTLPGIRETRLLCESLEVPVTWLMYGRISDSGPSKADRMLLAAMDLYVKNCIQTSVINDAREIEEMQKSKVRMDRLNRARKPNAT